MAQLSIHHIMSIVRNNVVLRNASLRALVFLALFECNGFVAARFRKKVSFAKKIVVTHSARAVYTARVAIHGTYTAVYTVRHGPYAAVYTAVHGRVHSRVHTHTCTPPLQGRVRAIYTAVYTASTQPYTRAVYTAAYTARRVHGR